MATEGIFAKFLAAQREFPQVKKAFKAQAFKGGGNYNYADINSILELVRPILNKHGLAVFQVTSTEGDSVGVETILRDEEGNSLNSGVLLVPTAGLMQKGVQAFGSAMTYARRYSLVTFLGIAYGDRDDDGAAASADAYREAERPAKPAQKPAAAPQGNWIEDLTAYAQKGTEEYKKAFQSLTGAQKKELVASGKHEELKALAEKANAPWDGEAPF